MNATVFHDIRPENRIFLCISAPATMEEAAKIKYSFERELDVANCTGQWVSHWAHYSRRAKRQNEKGQQ